MIASATGNMVRADSHVNENLWGLGACRRALWDVSVIASRRQSQDCRHAPGIRHAQDGRGPEDTCLVNEVSKWKNATASHSMLVNVLSPLPQQIKGLHGAEARQIEAAQLVDDRVRLSVGGVEQAGLDAVA